MHKYHATGETDKGKHGGHKRKLITEAHCDFLRELMEEDCNIILEYMQEQLEAVDGLHVSLSTIHQRIVGLRACSIAKKLRGTQPGGKQFEKRRNADCGNNLPALSTASS